MQNENRQEDGPGTAWLVVNGFLHSQKFDEIFAWLIQAAERQGWSLELKTNTGLLPEFVLGEPFCGQRMRLPRFVIFWDKDVRLARLLEKAGLRLFNCADSIEVCDDKARTFLELAHCGIRMPKTILGPKTFRPEGYADLSFLTDIEHKLGYPMILKECYGSFGQQVYLVRDRMETEACLRSIRNRPCLFQEYIQTSKGQDVRIQMVGERAVAAMHRYNPDDFRANITNGGKMEAYEPTAGQLEIARSVMRELRLDFAGIDILFGEQEEPVLCEVNSNAHFVNIYQCTGVNAADDIMRHCISASRKGNDIPGR